MSRLVAALRRLAARLTPDKVKAGVASALTFLVSSDVIDVGQADAVNGVVAGLLTAYAAVQLFRHPKES